MHVQLKRLKPGLRTVWRGRGSVQIGLSPSRGTVIVGLTDADSRLIEQLRTGAGPRTARQQRLIELLDDAGVLLTDSGSTDGDRLEPDAAFWSVVHPHAADGWPLLAARAGRRVLISGAGRLGSTLATTLTASGVGQICLLDRGRVAPADLAPSGAQPADLGRVRQDAAADAVVRAGGRASTAGSLADQRLADQRADVAVLIEYAVADAAAADVLVGADIPHLSIVVGEDNVVVGPLVRPGSGPCLRCLDLHRSGRDPAWPSMLAQLLGRDAADRGARGRGEEAAGSVLAAGLAALQVLAQLDGLSQPSSVGATLEIEPPDGLIARRSWPAHPGCGCHWPLRRHSPLPSAASSPGGGQPARTVLPGLPPEGHPERSGQPGEPSGADGRRMRP